MSFTLEVRFSGLCLHVFHPTRQESAILMPDARLNGSLAGAGAKHIDNAPAVPHTGYVSFSLRHLGFTPPARPVHADGVRGGQFDATYRFDQQQIDFGLPDQDQRRDIGEIPSFADFAPTLKLRDDLFTTDVASPLLFRVRLLGGAIAPSDDVDMEDKWMISGRLNPDQPATHEKSTPGSITWTREVEADTLTLTMSDFDGANPFAAELKPVVDNGQRVIRLHIANLCSDNPLEWDQFAIRGIPSGEDSDFKWFYRLFEPITGNFDTLLKKFFLPAPFLVKIHNPERYGGEAGNCGSGRTVAAYSAFGG